MFCFPSFLECWNICIFVLNHLNWCRSLNFTFVEKYFLKKKQGHDLSTNITVCIFYIPRLAFCIFSFSLSDITKIILKMLVKSMVIPWNRPIIFSSDAGSEEVIFGIFYWANVVEQISQTYPGHTWLLTSSQDRDLHHKIWALGQRDPWRYNFHLERPFSYVWIFVMCNYCFPIDQY